MCCQAKVPEALLGGGQRRLQAGHLLLGRSQLLSQAGHLVRVSLGQGGGVLHSDVYVRYARDQ